VTSFATPPLFDPLSRRSVQFTVRTRDGALFVNPLMAIYFRFLLGPLANASPTWTRLEDTVLMRQLAARIAQFRRDVQARIPKVFPH
jgi:hypothetical protein